MRLLDDGTAFGSVPAASPAKDRAIRAIRHGAMQSLPAPLLTATYLLATFGSGHRPAMLAIVAGMFATSVLFLLFADRVAANNLRGPLSALNSAFFVLGAAALAKMDGGIASPLGPLPLFFLPFIATTMPPRILIGVSVVAVTGYWAVALTGEPMLIGRAMVYSIPFVALAAICSLHWQTVTQLGKRLSNACRTDPLSGCLNRRGFDEALLAALGERAGSLTPTAMIAIDLDRFKAINDTFGHKTGDDAIAFAGEALRRTAGLGRLVARTGGDEFVIALLGDDEIHADALAREAQLALEPYLSASVGVGRFPQDADQLSGALKVADLRAYADKQAREESDPPAPVVRPPERVVSVCGRSSVEQRGRSIRATAATATFNNTVGLVYAMIQSEQNRELLAVLLGGGVIVSLILLLGTPRIARMRSAGTIVNTTGMLLVANAAAATVADGGAISPIAVGLLLPMVTVALSAPLRITLAVVPVLGISYLTIALTVGTPGFWYPFVHIMSISAISVAVAIQTRDSSARRRALAEVGRVDALTGLLTRSAFEQQIAERRSQGNRGPGEDWFIVIDLDDFKAVNDRFGHASGDALLQWVAKRFQGELRAGDLLARFGGDEFVIALDGYSERDAQKIVARLARVTAERTRASFGLAVASGPADRAEHSLGLADHRMYEQKLAHAQPANATS